MNLNLIIKIYLCLHVFGAVRAEENNFKKDFQGLENIEKMADIDSPIYDIVVLDFWASWCEPCKESFPFYENLIKQNSQKKVLFISINLDDEKKNAITFLKEHPSEFSSYWDKSKIFMKKLKFESIPHLIVLDKNWQLLESISGFNATTKAKFKKILKPNK